MGVDGNHDRNNVDIYSGSAIKHHIVLGYKLFGGGEGGTIFAVGGVEVSEKEEMIG